MEKKSALVILLIILIISTLAATGCINTSQDTTEIQKPPEKVISLSPSETEIFYAINTPDSGISLVGRTDYCDYPPEALTVPSVGGPQTLSVESIVSKDPDIIIGTTLCSKTVAEQLIDLDYNVRIYELYTFEDVYSNIESVGKLLGLEDSAGALVNEMKVREKQIEDSPKDDPAPKTWYVVAVQPLYAAGKGTLQSEMIEKAGGTNVFSDMEGYFVTSDEAVIARAPEVIIVPTGHGWSTVNFTEQILSKPEFKDLPAVKNGRVYTVNDDMVSIPGPRIVEGLELFYQCINDGIL